MPIDFKKINPELSYTLKQAAEFLDLSYGTILKFKKEKKLKTSRLGKRYYVKGMDILALVEKD